MAQQLRDQLDLPAPRSHGQRSVAECVSLLCIRARSQQDAHRPEHISTHRPLDGRHAAVRSVCTPPRLKHPLQFRLFPLPGRIAQFLVLVVAHCIVLSLSAPRPFPAPPGTGLHELTPSAYYGVPQLLRECSFQLVRSMVRRSLSFRSTCTIVQHRATVGIARRPKQRSADQEPLVERTRALSTSVPLSR